MHHLANCPLLNCYPGNHKMPCTGRMEAVGGSTGGPAIPRTPPRMPCLLLRELFHPPVGAPEIGRRWWPGWALPWSGAQRRPLSWLFWSHPTIGALRRADVPCFFDILFPLARIWGSPEILSFAVTLDKDGDGTGTPFVPSLVPNIWQGRWCSFEWWPPKIYVYPETVNVTLCGKGVFVEVIS